MEDYSRQRHVEGGYEFVTSPHISKSDLFETSGHLQWFAESMYPPMELDEGQRYYLKPMNCPFHVLIFKSRQRSYRELPLRFFEFGVGVSLREVRRGPGAHARARHDPGRRAHLLHPRADGRGARQPAAVRAGPAARLRPQRLLPRALDAPRGQGRGQRRGVGRGRGHPGRRSPAGQGLELVLDEGGGAFYGPKISVQARDAIGRTHQMSTIQLDFQTPQRFEATYVGADNAKQRPIMIHRALFGSVERFIAVLLEHYAGNLPTWLSPEQVRVLGVRDDHDAYAFDVAAALRSTACARRSRRRQRAPGRAGPARQDREDPLRSRGRRRRRRRGHRGGQRARLERPASAASPSTDFAAELAAEIAAHGAPEDRG